MIKLAQELGLKEPTTQKPRKGEKNIWRVGKAGREFVGYYTSAGLVRNKTYDLGELKYEDFWDLTRGILDGDGHIRDKLPYAFVSITSAAPKFIIWLEKELSSRGLYFSCSSYERRGRKGRWQSLYSSGEIAFETMRRAYKNPLIAMESKVKVVRKYERAYSEGNLRFVKDRVGPEDRASSLLLSSSR